VRKKGVKKQEKGPQSKTWGKQNMKNSGEPLRKKAGEKNKCRYQQSKLGGHRNPPTGTKKVVEGQTKICSTRKKTHRPRGGKYRSISKAGKELFVGIKIVSKGNPRVVGPQKIEGGCRQLWVGGL